MLCPQCKRENKDGVLYCAFCGAPLPASLTAQKSSVNDAPAMLQVPPAAPQRGAPVLQPRIPHDEQASGKTKGYLRKRRVLFGIALALTILSGALLLLSAVQYAVGSANAEPLPAAPFNPANSTVGEYVTTDLIYVLPFYQEGYEKRGIEHIETYTCMAIDVNGNAFTIEVPYGYYQEALSGLAAENQLEAPNVSNAVTVYGDVMTPDAKIQSALIAEVGNSDIVASMYAHNGLRVSDGPRTTFEDSGMFFMIYFSTFVLLAAVIFLVHMVKRLHRAQVLFAVYGNFIDLGESAKAAPLYQDKQICVNTDYLVSRKNPLLFACTSDILCVYLYEHSTKYFIIRTTDRLALVIHDRYGAKIQIHYKPKERALLKQTIYSIAPLLPNAVYGYTKENLQYVTTHQDDV